MLVRAASVLFLMIAIAFFGCVHQSAWRMSPAVSEASPLEAEKNFLRDLVRTTVAVSSYKNGAGVVLDWSGHILTNDHVLVKGDYYASPRKAVSIAATVDFCELRESGVPVCTGRARAEVIRRDPYPSGADLALLRICDAMMPPPSARPAEISDATPSIGEELWRIGRDPMPIAMGYYLESVLGFHEFRVGMPVAPGASGGPIFNVKGKVVGITRGHEDWRHWRLPVAVAVQGSYIKKWLEEALSISKPCAPRS